MRIPIVPVSGSDTELAIIELQGVIDITQGGSFQDFTLGPLVINDDDSALLTIGNHLLRGKVVKLKKPLAMVKRGTKEGLEIHAVIRKKVLFSDRPTLIFPDFNM